MGQGPGNRHPLLLAAREFVWSVVQAMSQPNSSQGDFGPTLTLRRFHSLIEQSVSNIVQGRLSRQQEELLEHKTNATSTKASQVLVGQSRRVNTVNPDRAASRPIQGTHDG